MPIDLNQYYAELACETGQDSLSSGTSEKISAEEYNKLEIELVIQAQNGSKKAENELVRRNLKFVVSIAKQYRHKDVPLSDLINAGNLGMIWAIKKFDPKRDIRFISYAVWWIRQYILQEIAAFNHSIRMPFNKSIDFCTLLTVKSNIEQRDHRNPSIEEIASEMKVDSRDLVTSMSCFKYATSTDALQMDNDSYSLIDVLADDNDTFIRDGVNSESLFVEIDKILRRMPKYEAIILKYNLGLGVEPMSLEKIGEKLSLSKERMRQLKEKAIEYIKNDKKSMKILRKFLNKNIDLTHSNILSKSCDLIDVIAMKNKRKKRKQRTRKVVLL